MSTKTRVQLLIACALGIALLLSSCDIFSVLDEPAQSGAEADRSADTGWKCVALLDAATYLCESAGRSVTASLAYVLVPGCGDSSDHTRLAAITGAADQHIATMQSQAFDFVYGLIRGATVRLYPEPGGAPALATSVRVGRDDLAAMLLEAGLAVVDTNAPGVPGLLAAYQQRALEAEQGLWRVPGDLRERFTITVDGAIESFNRRSGRGADLDLPRFHAADLVRAPAVRISDTIEDEAGIATVCDVNVDIRSSGPPKIYAIDVILVPQLKMNEYSGPLSTFKDGEGEAVIRSIALRGGETSSMRLESDEIDLSRVTRAAGVQVFSGALVSGYILNVEVDGTLIHSTTGAFQETYTLELL